MIENLKLPLVDMEVMDDELMFVLGGAGNPESITGSGSGCGYNCNNALISNYKKELL